MWIFEILYRIVTSVFDLKQVQLFEIHKGVQENDVSVKMCVCTVLLLTMVQVLYLREVFILARYGPPSTETPTTETTTVQCHKNDWIYLTSTYYWWLLRPTITIRFDSKFQLFDWKWKKQYSQSTKYHWLRLVLSLPLHVILETVFSAVISRQLWTPLTIVQWKYELMRQNACLVCTVQGHVWGRSSWWGMQFGCKFSQESHCSLHCATASMSSTDKPSSHIRSK